LVEVDDEFAVNGEAEIPVGGGGSINKYEVKTIFVGGGGSINKYEVKMIFVCKGDVCSYKMFSRTVLF
jgi:hypothetical protein